MSDNNESAFPRSGSMYFYLPKEHEEQLSKVAADMREADAKAKGVTILDYFAGKAMQGDWAAQNEDCVIDEVLATRARLYYRAAKAMMRVRAELSKAMPDDEKLS